MSTSNKDMISEMIEMLTQRRDELKVKLSLGKLEARDEWEKVVLKLDELKRRHDRVMKASGEASEEVFTALKTLGDEIKEGFNHIRKSM
ncbi:MAG: hypothetical protein GC159_01230 [Phycisphaera sp.]|nr:hypothetical protein [Phycisphaera sp.]